MLRIASRSLLFTALALVPVVAQKTMQAHSDTVAGARTDSVHLIISMDNGKFAGLPGAAFISYVPAKWKAEFANQAKVDEVTIGHLFRLGQNNWATLDNYVPITFGNVTVPAGIWYLGIARDTTGSKWTLVIIDPAKAKAAGVVPPMADNAPRTYEVPLPVENVKDVAETMAVSLSADAKEPARGTLTIAFGNMKTSVKYELKVPAAVDASSKDAGGKKK